MNNPLCDLCENFDKVLDHQGNILPFSCGKCGEESFQRNGDCIPSCQSNDIILNPNKICMAKQECLVENCAQCIEGNSSLCKICFNGRYMYNNQCLHSCPFKLRADRISWTCLETPIFAWYWIFPSRASCRSRCGKLIGFDMDCSCTDDCFRFGNCCQDIEDNCPQYIFWN